MQKCIIGKKIGMTQIFDEVGNVIPVTVVEAGPCVVVQKKTTDIDGYEAVQIGFGDAKLKNVNKPMQGHFNKADVACKKVLKEFRLADCSTLEVGSIVKADTFSVGDIIDVSGTSKGKGFQGTVKKNNNSRLKETHGSGPVQNLEIVKIDVDNNLIAIKGAVPGAKGGIVYISDSVKKA